MDEDGNVKTLPLFVDIDIRTPKCTFSHPNSLLFATQFAQIALVVTEKVALEDIRRPFYRGITMQRAVEREAQNRSNYAMCAVNPSRISPTFSDAALTGVGKGSIGVEIVKGLLSGVVTTSRYNRETVEYYQSIF
ncbi:hypothetical protein C8J56DRAFT_1092163 [Mycena floridula]|nr:hypothetical protein C8J56DRAFT_1092163 [Mycena floridula]